MELLNHTGVPAGWTMGFERTGREFLIVAVKATFTVPRLGESPELEAEQVPLTEADQFTGEPGRSAPLYESDYAHRKPLCDVLLNGSAYAPLDKRSTSVTAGLRVGTMVKVFRVVGNRAWRRGIRGVQPSTPEPFEAMSVSYDSAFGGVDDSKGPDAPVMTYLENPVGRGYWHHKERIDGKPLPNTEELDNRITQPTGSYRPMSFGAVGRNWHPRVLHAGTYDQRWMDTEAPFWPRDFDYDYFQAAPIDQRIPFPVGGEDVVLKNLTPDGEVAFQLPRRRMPVWFLPYRGKDTCIEAVVDTLLIEPDQGRFSLTWRATLAMRRSCFDIKRVVVGEMPEVWQRARRYGNKPYYKGLAELIRAKRGKR